MSDNSYQQYHHTLIETLYQLILSQPPFNGDDLDELQAQFIQKFDLIRSAQAPPEQILAEGQWVIAKIVSDYSGFVGAIPRDLFWYFGGDCLHFLGDEEIRRFQQLDEAYHQAGTSQQSVDYAYLVEHLGGGSQELQ